MRSSDQENGRTCTSPFLIFWFDRVLLLHLNKPFAPVGLACAGAPGESGVRP